MRYTHHAQQWLPHPIETVFDFFANPANLPRLMPAWQKAKIKEQKLAPPPPLPSTRGNGKFAGVAAGQGSRLTITFRPIPGVPIRMAWDAEITEFVWDDHFCDVQLKRGPFAYWHHCHRLEARPRDGQPGTLLRDQVDYELPMGPLGDIASFLFVRKQMDYIFSYRHRRAEELLARS